VCHHQIQLQQKRQLLPAQFLDLDLHASTYALA
jgi:hypothetical protein